MAPARISAAKPSWERRAVKCSRNTLGHDGCVCSSKKTQLASLSDACEPCHQRLRSSQLVVFDPSRRVKGAPHRLVRMYLGQYIRMLDAALRLLPARFHVGSSVKRGVKWVYPYVGPGRFLKSVAVHISHSVSQALSGKKGRPTSTSPRITSAQARRSHGPWLLAD